jgi:CheY-like chemotaxis protein
MGRGTGLGLASVYGIIKSHGGYIDVNSERGKGTTFMVYLQATREAIEESTITAPHVVKGSETILLVDDEKIIRNVGRELLQQMGYTVLLAGGGTEAVEIYRKNRDTIDLVILDMIMPDMNGGEVYDRLKEIAPGIKVLLSSGYSIDGQATEILERGCDGFIQKPFTIKQLSQKIREILDGP